ncbi:TPA: hypothetical protein ACH3X2_014105 [Trebouxia sp. C0005]
MQTLLWAGQAALLLHHTSMARMLSSLLRQVAASAAVDSAPAALQLRHQVYRTASDLVTQGGIGVGSLLGPEVINCALLELYGSKQSKKRPAEEGLVSDHVPKKQKKNKKEDALPSLDAMLADGTASSGAQQQPGTDFNCTSPGPQEAALHMLESLVQAAGSSMSQQQRAQIDAIVAHIASTAGLAIDQISQSFEGNPSQAGTVAIQLAALRALLASVLCPAPHRPSFLPQALMLFAQGSQSPAPQVAAFSRQALLALEGIIHPRAGHTIFPSHRPSASMHPYTSSSTSIDQPTDLGVPKFWSAVTPASPSIQPHSQPPTAASAQAVDAVGTAAAREVLRAGQVYTAAVAKLEAALAGSAAGAGVGTVADAPAAEINGRVSGEHEAIGSVSQGLKGISAAGPATGVTAAPAATMTAAAPIGKGDQRGTGADQYSVTVSTVSKAPNGVLNAAPAGAATGGAAGDHSIARQQVSGACDAPAAMEADVAEQDGYISLEQGRAAAWKSTTSGAQQPTSAAAVSLLERAESSDSQGSLPEIDSGESSDSSTME